MEKESLRAALRDRTRGLHDQLDTALTGPGGRVPDLPAYVRVLRSLHALHAHADGPLRSWAQRSSLASPLDPELLPDRSAAYAADLTALGETLTGAPAAPGDSVDDGRGLALLYLVAGSAAGARVLLRGLPDVVPAEARRGLTEAAGPASTRLWRATVSLLGRPPASTLGSAVVAEARAVLQRLIDESDSARGELVAP